MRILNLLIVSIVFLTMLCGKEIRSNVSVKFFWWTGIISYDGKLDFRQPLRIEKIKEIVNKGIVDNYYKVVYIDKNPKKVIKYVTSNKEVKEITFLDKNGIVMKTITFKNDEINSSLSCNYTYKTFDIKYKRVNRKECDNGFKEDTYYNSLGIYKRVRSRNEKLTETMTYKSPYCYYFDANNSLTEIDACILEPNNVPIRIFSKPK